MDKGVLQKIRGLIDEPRIVMMATRLDRFPYSARPKTPRYVHPMTLQQIDDIGCLWFLTSKKNSHFRDITKNKKVQIIYSNEEEKKYLSILGNASYVINKQKVDELWNPLLNNWFESKENPNMALLNVDIVDANYWDCRNNKLVPFFKKMQPNGSKVNANLYKKAMLI